MQNWPKIIEEIQRKFGLTEKAIADRAGCTQPTINRIKQGTRNPKYSIGAKLMALHESTKRAA